MTGKSTTAVFGAKPEDYSRFGLAADHIEPWEDGARTDGSAGTYEWWYFDAHLADGAKLVVVFFTKPFADVDKPLDPTIRIELELPDGRSLNKIAHWKAEEFSAATTECAVRIGDNIFAGDLHSYRIQARIEEVSVEIELTGEVPAWRPLTGYMLFGDKGEHYFAWLPSVPQGKAEVTYSIAGQTHRTSGVGYHDHNWGDIAMQKLINNWYWARGQAGGFSVIASYITAEEKYGYAELPIFMLAKDGAVIADDSAKVTFATEGVYTDATTGKPVANITRYEYRDGDQRYVVTFTRHSDLALAKLVEEIKGPKRLAAMLLGFDGAYLRFTGELRIEQYQDERLVESHVDEAIWELMYFGSAKHKQI